MIPGRLNLQMWNCGYGGTAYKEALPTPGFLPGKSKGQRRLVSYSPQGRKDTAGTWVQAPVCWVTRRFSTSLTPALVKGHLCISLVPPRPSLSWLQRALSLNIPVLYSIEQQYHGNIASNLWMNIEIIFSFLTRQYCKDHPYTSSIKAGPTTVYILLFCSMLLKTTSKMSP